MKVVSTLHDCEGRFLPLVRKSREDLVRNLTGTIVSHTKETDKRLIALLRNLGLVPVLGGRWGEARRMGVAKAFEFSEERFFYCDFDKILHWLLVERDEFISLLNCQTKKDFLILGREKKVFETYPQSWQRTESIINELVSEKFGFKADIMASACILNRKAGRKIADQSREKEWGSCVEWPLLAFKAELEIGYQEAKGLTWEDPDRFSKEIKKIGDRKAWQEKNYGSIKEWERRVMTCGQQLAVIKRLG